MSSIFKVGTNSVFNAAASGMPGGPRPTVSGPIDAPTRPNPVGDQRAAYVASQNEQYLLDPSGDALNKPKSKGAASRSLGSTF